MKVLVFQSHAPNVPHWLLRCTASVREWASRQGYEYRLLGDELFDGIPTEIAVRAQSLLPLSDMGRLLWAERLLAEWGCVIWIDADVLVFAPAQFAMDVRRPYQVCREVLVRRGSDGALTVLDSFNPTVLMFRGRSPFLRRWLALMKERAARRRGLGDADLGRELLPRVASLKRLPAICSIGHFNAAILREIYGSGGPGLALMMRTSGAPYAAANLCGHHALPNAAYQTIIDRLLDTAGEVVNQHLPGRVSPMVSSEGA